MGVVVYEFNSVSGLSTGIVWLVKSKNGKGRMIRAAVMMMVVREYDLSLRRLSTATSKKYSRELAPRRFETSREAKVDRLLRNNTKHIVEFEIHTRGSCGVQYVA